MSRKVQHILFPTDFSEAAQYAFVHALLLARVYDCPITLLHVIYPEYEALDLPVMAAQATQEKVAAARGALAGFRDLGLDKVRSVDPEGAAPRIELATELGSAASLIAHVARRDGADLIVMGTRGEHNALERAFGSVSTGVLERADRPVWLVPEAAEYRRPRSVLYATGFEESGPEPLREAVRVLAPFQVDLHIGHARKAGVDVERADFTGWDKYLDREDALGSVSFHEGFGDTVEEALEQMVQKLEADLLVMYAPKHSLLERLFGISHTKHMARRTEVPLLVVKGARD